MSTIENYEGIKDFCVYLIKECLYLDQRVSFSTEEEGNANIKIRIVFDNQKYALFYF